MEKNLTESQILNFYNDAKKLDEPIVGKIMVLRFEFGQYRSTSGHKIVEVGKGCFKAVNKWGGARWYKKDKSGRYEDALMKNGRLHFEYSLRIRNRKDYNVTFYDMAECITYSEDNAKIHLF